MKTLTKTALGAGTAAAVASALLVHNSSVIVPPPAPVMALFGVWVPDTNVVAVEFWHTTDLTVPFTPYATFGYTPTNFTNYSFPETNQQEFFIARSVDADGNVSDWATNQY